MEDNQLSVRIQEVMDGAVLQARSDQSGQAADYIPELANVKTDLTSVAMLLVDGQSFVAGDVDEHVMTLQSVSKVVVLAGLLEEYGADQVFSWIGVEPSGRPFASIAQLEQYGPIPANPMINSGAIALCSHIEGNGAERLVWLQNWMQRLFGAPLCFNRDVFRSEQATGDRNRSLAYLMRSSQMIEGNVEDILATYFSSCSFEVNVRQAAYFPMLLANGGIDPQGNRVLKTTTVQAITAIMATCGLYDESGYHLVTTGMPAKSGVSGLVIACAMGQAGVAAASPRVNYKGTSVRGHIILQRMAESLKLHFATPRGEWLLR